VVSLDRLLFGRKEHEMATTSLEALFNAYGAA
jgi:hypothetical protein